VQTHRNDASFIYATSAFNVSELNLALFLKQASSLNSATL